MGDAQPSSSSLSASPDLAATVTTMMQQVNQLGAMVMEMRQAQMAWSAQPKVEKKKREPLGSDSLKELKKQFRVSDFTGRASQSMNMQALARSFLSECEQKYKMCQVPFEDGQDNTEAVATAIAHLKEQAMSWWTSVEDNQQQYPNIRQQWSVFRRAFSDQYLPPQHAISARARLHTIRQGDRDSIQFYCHLFRTLRAEAGGMNEEDALLIFRRGLKPHLRTIVNNRNPTTVEQAMAYAVEAECFDRVERALQQPSVNSNRNGGWKNRTGSYGHWTQSTNTRFSNQTATVTDTSTPMEIGMRSDEEDPTEHGNDDELHEQQLHAMQQTRRGVSGNRRLTDEERARCMSAGLCFACRRPGHRARECPTSSPSVPSLRSMMVKPSVQQQPKNQ
jgi:hypothetical protein